MIAIVRWVLGLFNREHLLLSRYRKSHPHFILYLSLDAVLSATIVLAGFQFAASHTSTDLHAIMRGSGVIAMSSSELIEHAKKNGRPVYWLGPMRQNRYMLIHSQGDIGIIVYLPKGSNPANVNQPKLTIETYKNFAAYATDLHPFLGTNSTKLATTSGITVEFNKASMDYEIVTFRDKPDFVIIHYPMWQLAATLMKNANNLKLVG